MPERRGRSFRLSAYRPCVCVCIGWDAGTRAHGGGGGAGACAGAGAGQQLALATSLVLVSPAQRKASLFAVPSKLTNNGRQLNLRQQLNDDGGGGAEPPGGGGGVVAPPGTDTGRKPGVGVPTPLQAAARTALSRTQGSRSECPALGKMQPTNEVRRWRAGVVTWGVACLLAATYLTR